MEYRLIALFTDKKKWYSLFKELIQWLGTPHRHLQAEIGKGADCALFFAKCLESIGVLNKVNFTYAPRFWHKFLKENVLLQHISDYMVNNFNIKYSLISKDINTNLQRGDLLVFRIRSKLANHMAMYLGNSLIINSVGGRGVCIIHYSDVYKKRLTNVYRIYNV